MGQNDRRKKTIEETYKSKEERSAEIKNLLKKLSDLEITAKTPGMIDFLKQSFAWYCQAVEEKDSWYKNTLVVINNVTIIDILTIKIKKHSVDDSGINNYNNIVDSQIEYSAACTQVCWNVNWWIVSIDMYVCFICCLS